MARVWPDGAAGPRAGVACRRARCSTAAARSVGGVRAAATASPGGVRCVQCWRGQGPREPSVMEATTHPHASCVWVIGQGASSAKELPQAAYISVGRSWISGAVAGGSPHRVSEAPPSHPIQPLGGPEREAGPSRTATPRIGPLPRECRPIRKRSPRRACGAGPSIERGVKVSSATKPRRCATGCGGACVTV